MRGHIEKRRKSSWTVVIELGRDAEGKKKRITRAVKGLKRDAEQVMRQMLYELETGSFVERKDIKFGEYIEKWLSIRASKLAPMTLDSYRRQFEKHIIPALGEVPLQKLTPLHLQEYLRQLEISGRLDGQGGLSSRTIVYHYRLISECLKQAVKLQLIPRNPAEAIDAPKQKKKEMSVLYRDELIKLMEKLKEHRYYGVVLCAVFTGMRQGEILGLRWIDIDFTKGVICVRQQLQYIPRQGYFFKEPKSAKSKREIPIPMPLMKIFRQTKKEQAEYRIALGDEYVDYDLVFCQPNGKPWDGGNLTNWFRSFMNEFGRKDIRFHDLRHTFASLALAAGMSMEKLQRILGHESITTTINTYSHFSHETLDNEMQKLTQYLGF